MTTNRTTLTFGLMLGSLLIAAACGGADSQTEAVSGSTTDSIPTNEVATTTPTSSTVPEPDSTSTTTEAAPEFGERFSTGGLFETTTAPVITNGEPGDWDWQYTDPGAAVFHDGAIHVFQNGFVGWPAAVGIGYWRSDDGGLTFQEVSSDPVFDPTDLPYVGVAGLASSALVEDDGTWVLYFYTWDAGTWPVGPSTIGRATAPEPTGPWTADPEPILIEGTTGEWDELAVRSPSVVRTDNGYLMFFAGTTRDVSMIGMATSDDGITWTKYDDPETTEPPFAASDPVLVPGNLSEGNIWDQRNVYIPNVVSTDDGLVMMYSSSTTVTDPTRLFRKAGLAVSQDGLEWTRARSPLIGVADFAGDSLYYSELVATDDAYVALFEIGHGNETEVHAARYVGRLPPGG